MRKTSKGFTLIELAIAITIIGLLIAGVIKGTGLVDGAKVSSAITLSQDVSSAINIFKQRYHMMPGDLLIDDVTPEIPDVLAACRKNGANAGNNNGRIDAGLTGMPDESRCVPEVLFRAGMAKVDKDGAWAVFNTSYGQARVKAVSQSNVAAGFSPSITHVLEFNNLPCDIVRQIDSKIDNDDLTSGKAIAAGGACVLGTPVTFYAIAI
jgi:prepilin-type N-terminal cleavage/methylation domain-containing protein